MPQILSEYGRIIGSGTRDIQFTSIAQVANAPIGKIIQYTGQTTDDFVTGYFYVKTEDGWVQINVQPEQAQEIPYDGSASGSTATNVQEAIDSVIVGMGGISFSVIEE